MSDRASRKSKQPSLTIPRREGPATRTSPQNSDNVNPATNNKKRKSTGKESDQGTKRPAQSSNNVHSPQPPPNESPPNNSTNRRNISDQEKDRQEPTPGGAALDSHSINQVIQGQGTPTGSTPTTVTPPSQLHMQTLVELTRDTQTYKAIVRTQVKEKVWQICKLPDYNSQGGRRMKLWFEKQLKLTSKEFEHLWNKKDKDGIKCQINDTLRIQRAYVCQQMKVGYYGVCARLALSVVVLADCCFAPLVAPPVSPAFFSTCA